VHVGFTIVSAEVAADAIGVMDRDVEAIPGLILDLHVLAFQPGQTFSYHPMVASDAVLDMDDIVALFEIAKERLWRRLALSEHAAPLPYPAKDLCVREHSEARGRQGTPLSKDTIQEHQLTGCRGLWQDVGGRNA